MKVVIIGSGVAGYTAAAKLREYLSDSAVSLFDACPDEFYAKMRLPEYIAGKLSAQKLALSTVQKMKELGIDTHLGEKITGVDVSAKTVTTAAGAVHRYDKLILACGARANVPKIAGQEKAEILTLRTKCDADRIIAMAKSSKEAVILGGGLLGLEMACSLKELGLAVHVVEFMDRLLPRQLDEIQSAVLLEKFTAMGFRVTLSTNIESVETDQARTITLVSSDGRKFTTGMLLVSAGIISETTLAADAGIKVAKGIIADNRFETSVRDVYAVGDCAEVNGRIWGLWAAAKDQGDAVAAIIAGKISEFQPPAYCPSLKITGIQMKELCSEADKRRPQQVN